MPNEPTPRADWRAWAALRTDQLATGRRLIRRARSCATPHRAQRHSQIASSDAGRSCRAPLRNNVVMKEDRRVAAVLVRYSLRLSACVGIAAAAALAVVATTVGIAPPSRPPYW